MCQMQGYMYLAREINGHIYVLDVGVYVPSQEIQRSYICVRCRGICTQPGKSAVIYMCQMQGYVYLARKVSGHIYVLDVGVYVPSQESQRSYICVRCRGICTQPGKSAVIYMCQMQWYMYLARKVSGHIYVLDVGVYVPSQESQRSYICVRCRGICSQPGKSAVIYMCQMQGYMYQESQRSYICVRQGYMYLARKVTVIYMCQMQGYMYLARKVSGDIYVLDVGIYVPSQESQRSYICVRCRGMYLYGDIYVLDVGVYVPPGKSAVIYMCQMQGYMYLARKVSGHIYVLDVGVYVPSQESQRSYICVRCRDICTQPGKSAVIYMCQMQGYMYLARKVRSHIYVLDVGVYVPSQESQR